MRRQVRYIATVLLALLLQPAVVHAQNEQGDVTLQVTPVQSVLPPQAGRYIDNLGRYFSVTVINNTDVQQNLYFGVQIKQLFPDDVLWMSTDVETMHIPQRPIVLAPNQHKTLNTIELKHLFDHFDSKDIYVRDGRYRNILDSEFGLLDEGQYELYLTAYEWATDLTTPVVKNNQTDGIARFNICYEAEPPRFTLPIREATTEGLSDLSVTKIDKNQASIRFEWMAPTLNCNATMVQFRYNIRFVELGSMMPDEAMQENTITFLEKRELLTNSFTIPQAYLSQMIADTAFLGKVYAMQVTAYTPYQNENSLNVALIKNEGKSDIFLFQLYDPTKKPESAISGKGLGTDDQAGPVYIFEQPTLTSPQFPEDATRLIYMGDSIKVEWRKAWHVGGKGERQDTIDFKYNVALYTGNSADSRDAILKTSKPLYEKTTEELTDTIRWDEIADKVHQGDYLLLRVTAKPTCTPDSIVEMKSDSVNITDFALTRHFDEEYQCGHENIQVANKTTLGEVPDKNKSIKIGRFYLTLDGPEPVTYDKDKETYKGKGWIRWSPKADNYFNMNSRVAVKFDNLKINTDYEVYEGRCVTYPYSDGKTEYTDAQAVDSLFSLASLDEIYGSLDLPDEVRSLVSKGVNEWGDDVEEATKSLAKSYNLGKYYSTYKLLGAKWEDMQHGDAFDLYFPMEVPEEISKFLPKSFSVQIGSMQFTPQSAQMNVIGEIALPNSDVFDGQNVLIFGAPRLCITPDKFWPEEGVLALLSNLPLKDPNTDFKMTFKAPTEPLDPRPGDGCFLRWDADGFAGLGMHIAMTMPNTKRVVDGQAKDIPALLDLKATIEGGDDAMDFIATGSLTPFEAVDLPGWTFHIGEDIIFDYNMSRNDRLMPTIDEFKKSYAQMSYDEEKKKFVTKGDDTTFDATLCGAYVNDGNWDAWQGVYIRNLEVEFPKFAVFGNGKQGTKIGASNMLIDASGITCRVFSENVLDAQTGKCGGWKFTLDKAYVDIIQNNFDNCTITGGFGVPLLGKVAQDKAADEAAKKDGGKSGSSTEKKDDQQETDIEYYCQIRHMTKPGYKEYQVWNKAGTEKVTKKRKEYDDKRLSYVFTTKNADKAPLAMNFFVADMTLLPDQTYFLVESVDPEKEGGEQYTQVELCMAGDITIAGLDGKHDENANAFAKRIAKIKEQIPLELKMPGIHFAKMRLSNVRLDDWKDLEIDEYRTHQTGIESQEAWEAEHKKLYEFTEGRELALSKECYFNYGEWSLASAQKKIGPFKIGLEDFSLKYSSDKLILGVDAMIGLANNLFTVKAGVDISATTHTEGSVGDWYISDGKVDFRMLELDVDVANALHLNGKLEVSDKKERKGYAGSLKVEIIGLFSVDCEGGYFKCDNGLSEDEEKEKKAQAQQLCDEDHKANYKSTSTWEDFYDADPDYDWGYFTASVSSKAGIHIDPIVINRISGGFYVNCRPTQSGTVDGHPMFAGAPEPQYGLIGVMFGIGLSTTAGEEALSGDVDLMVVYDRVQHCMSTFKFNGRVKAVSGIVDAQMSLVYLNQTKMEWSQEEKMKVRRTKERYLSLNITVETGIDTSHLVDKLMGMNSSLENMQTKLNQFQGNVGKVLEKPSLNPAGNLDEINSDYSEKAGSKKTKLEGDDQTIKGEQAQKQSEAARMGKSKMNLELKITWAENYEEYSPVRWHLYLGEPEESKRCQFILVDFKSKIVSVNIGADGYLCMGNELPGDGRLPEIPLEIRSFLNGDSGDGVYTTPEMEKAQKSRNAAAKALNPYEGNVNGGVMAGAKAWGYIDVDLGLFYGYLRAIAGFDISLVHFKHAPVCVDYGSMGYRDKKPGEDGYYGSWYAEGQFYAYLAAKFGLHIKLGKLIDKHIDILNAGIGGVMKMGLPHPVWIDGQARVKVSLLSGLVRIDKKFTFTCGKHCEPFLGNALDGFELFNGCTLASDDKKQGWDMKNAISVNEANKISFTTNASLGQRYRLVDPSKRKQIAEADGAEADDTRYDLQASRTYVFDLDQDFSYGGSVRLYEFTDVSSLSYISSISTQETSVKETSAIMNGYERTSSVKRTVNSSDATVVSNIYSRYKSNSVQYATIEKQGHRYHLKNISLKPDRYYLLQLSGTGYEIKDGRRVWPEVVHTNDYEPTHWMQTKYYFFCTKGTTTFDDMITDLQPYVALARPSAEDNGLFNKLGEEIECYLSDVNNPYIAFNQSGVDVGLGQVMILDKFKKKYPNCQLNWKIQRLNDDGSKVDNVVVRKAVIKSDKSGGRYQYGIAPEVPFEFDQRWSFNIKLQMSYFKGYETRYFKDALAYVYSPRSGKQYPGSYNGDMNKFDFPKVLVEGELSEFIVKKYGASNLYKFDQELATMKEDPSFAALSRAEQFTKFIESKGWYDQFSDWVTPIRDQYVEVRKDSDFTVPVYEKIDLADLYVKPYDYGGGHWRRPGEDRFGTYKDHRLKIEYEQPYIGATVEKNGVQFDYTINRGNEWNDVTVKPTNDALPTRLLDPFLYFAFLQRWVFLGDISVKAYSWDNVSTPYATESLVFTLNNTDVTGSLLNSDWEEGMDLYQLRDAMYSCWINTLDDVTYPLPISDEYAREYTLANQREYAAGFDSWLTNNRPHLKGFKQLFEKLAEPYYVAEELCGKIDSIFRKLISIDNGTLPVPRAEYVAKQMQEWSDVHRGLYLEVSRGSCSVRVPYYQFPLLAMPKEVFANNDKKGNIPDMRKNQAYWGTLGSRLTRSIVISGHNVTPYPQKYQEGWGYNGDEFKAAEALKHIKSIRCKSYRLNAFDVNTGLYTYSSKFENKTDDEQGAGPITYDIYQTGGTYPVDYSIFDILNYNYQNQDGSTTGARPTPPRGRLVYGGTK